MGNCLPCLPVTSAHEHPAPKKVRISTTPTAPTDDVAGPKEDDKQEAQQYIKGDLVQIFSKRRQKWLDGTIKEAFQSDCTYDGHSVKAGTLLVALSIDSGFKYVLPEDVGTDLRKASSVLPGPPADTVFVVRKQEQLQQMEEPPSSRESKEEVITGKTREEEVTLWLERLSGERRENREFGEWLRDGQVLCKAANAVEPNIIQKIHTQQMPFKQMENITNFIRACRKLGVLEKDLFSTVDLHEEKNLKVVQICVYNFASRIRTTAPSFSGPYLGVQQKAVVKDEQRRTVQEPSLVTGFRLDIATEVRDSVPRDRM